MKYSLYGGLFLLFSLQAMNEGDRAEFQENEIKVEVAKLIILNKKNNTPKKKLSNSNIRNSLDSQVEASYPNPISKPRLSLEDIQN